MKKWTDDAVFDADKRHAVEAWLGQIGVKPIEVPVDGFIEATESGVRLELFDTTPDNKLIWVQTPQDQQRPQVSWREFHGISMPDADLLEEVFDEDHPVSEA